MTARGIFCPDNLVAVAQASRRLDVDAADNASHRPLAYAAGAWLRTASGLLLACLPVGPAYATLLAAAGAPHQPIGLDYGESIVYGHAFRLVQGQALYQPIDAPPFTVAAYPPLYYALAAALQSIVGPGFGPGRVLSLLAGVTAAVLVGLVAARRASYAWIGPFAALVFLALAFPGGTPWLGLYRVDVLGIALSVAAIFVLTYGQGTPASIGAGVLAGLALLTKQTFFAALLAGVLWRWPDRRQAGALLGAAVFTFGIPCVVLELTTGAFIQNTLLANLNPFDLSVADALVREFFVLQWLPLLLAAVYLGMRRPWRPGAARLPVLYWAAASVSCIGLAKVGANHNYWIEFAAATAILAGCGAASLVRVSSPGLAAAGTAGLILVVGTTVGGPLFSTLLGGTGGVRTAAFEVQSQFAALSTNPRDPEFDALVDRVRNEPGGVLADPLDVVVLAGRPVVLEPLIYSILLDTGYWRADSLVAQICTGEIRLLVLGYSLEEGASLTFGRYTAWPKPVMAALRERMQLEGVNGRRQVYTSLDPAPVVRSRVC